MTRTNFRQHAKPIFAAAAATVLATAAFASNDTLPPQSAMPQVTLAQMVEDNGASARVDSAGKLRMLSQRVTAAACYVRAGVATAETLPALILATDDFDGILNALEFGDPARGIFGAEERRKTLVGLSILRDEHWAPFSEQARLVASGAGDASTITLMAEQSAPLLEFAVRMVSEIAGQYSDPAILLQSDAMVIDVAGRQRMLAQKISKAACLIGTGLATDATRAELDATVEIFEASLQALNHGMPEAGIKAPPTQEISDGIAGVSARWSELLPVLASVAAGEGNEESLAIIYAQTTAITAEMNAIVGLYGAASKMEL